jgi:hypothetical protein
MTERQRVNCTSDETSFNFWKVILVLKGCEIICTLDLLAEAGVAAVSPNNYLHSKKLLSLLVPRYVEALNINSKHIIICDIIV